MVCVYSKAAVNAGQRGGPGSSGAPWSPSRGATTKLRCKLHLETMSRMLPPCCYNREQREEVIQSTEVAFIRASYRLKLPLAGHIGPPGTALADSGGYRRQSSN